MPFHPQEMEDTMCWEIDYQFWAEQKKAEAQQKRDQRAGVIDQLLNDANKQTEAEVRDELPVKEVVPAK
jgi:Rps23 Pro-64 3,4-dihydroxylase Tpa1-like proline 4-hydroxylase